MEQTFDEIYSVSDLHLGGVKPFQIFSQGELLAEVIRYIARRPADKAVALVLNGDVVDFLAEDDPRYLDVDNAARKLERIVADDSFHPVFLALRDFVHVPRRTLVIGMGNHDVELGLPASRRLLEGFLAEGDEAALGRIRWALDGTGFRARAGNAQVLFLHGNEADGFNVVDHCALREVVRALNAGSPPKRWAPNAGTKLVIDVMNDIKRRLPLVDLLKPEAQAVLPVLIALDAELFRRIKALAPVLIRLANTMIRQSLGLLSAEGAPRPEPPSEDMALAELLSMPRTQYDPNEMMKRAERALASGEPALDWSRLRGGPPERLGTGGLVLDRLFGRDKDEAENLLEALQHWLANDRTFDPSAPSPSGAALDGAVSPEIDFLVSGHTHLERALKRKNGHGRYFNSGTWAGLIRVAPQWLASKEAFAPVYAAFKDGRLSTLQEAKLITRIPTVVAIRSDGGRVTGELTHATLDSGAVRLEPVAGEGG